MPEKYRMISELKSNDCLKVDGRKVDVLLLVFLPPPFRALHLRRSGRAQKYTPLLLLILRDVLKCYIFNRKSSIV